MFEGLPPGLRPVAERQQGVLTARQLLAGGVTSGLLKSRVSQGRWQWLQRGVYAVFSGQPQRSTELWAAVLAAGTGAMLSHWTAAELCGLVTTPSRSIHVTVPNGRRVSRIPGVVIHRSAHAGTALHPVKLPPQTRIEETVFDLVSLMKDIDGACAWPLRAVGKGLTTTKKLHEAMRERPKMRWRSAMTELLTPDAAGLHSILELRYHRDVELPHGLPRGKRQEEDSLDGHRIYRDKFYEEYLVAVELDGRLAHPADRRWDDIRRDNAAAADGIRTLRYGWLPISAHACEVAAEVLSVLYRHGFTGGRPCSARCPAARVVGRYQRPA